MPAGAWHLLTISAVTLMQHAESSTFCPIKQLDPGLSFIGGNQSDWNITAFDQLSRAPLPINSSDSGISFPKTGKSIGSMQSIQSFPYGFFEIEATISLTDSNVSDGFAITVASRQSANMRTGSSDEVGKSVNGVFWPDFVGFSIVFYFYQPQIRLLNYAIAFGGDSSADNSRPNGTYKVNEAFNRNDFMRKNVITIQVNDDQVSVKFCHASDTSQCTTLFDNVKLLHSLNAILASSEKPFHLVIGTSNFWETSGFTVHSVNVYSCKPWPFFYIAGSHNPPFHNFVGAWNTCRDKGGWLAALKTADEQALAVSYLIDQNINSGCWMGLYYDCDKWRWAVDGSEFIKSRDVNKFGNGEPNGQGPSGIENCVHLNLGSWNDLPCFNIWGALCYNSTLAPPPPEYATVEEPNVYGCQLKTADWCDRTSGSQRDEFSLKTEASNYDAVGDPLMPNLTVDGFQLIPAVVNAKGGIWSKVNVMLDNFEIYAIIKHFHPGIDGPSIMIANEAAINRTRNTDLSWWLADWPKFDGFAVMFDSRHWRVSLFESSSGFQDSGSTNKPWCDQNTTARTCYQRPIPQSLIGLSTVVYKVRLKNDEITAAVCDLKDDSKCWYALVDIPFSWSQRLLPGKSYFVGVSATNGGAYGQTTLKELRVHDCNYVASTTNPTTTSATIIADATPSVQLTTPSSISDDDEPEMDSTQKKLDELSQSASSIANQEFFMGATFQETSVPSLTTDDVLSTCDHINYTRTSPPFDTHVKMTFAVDRFLGINTIEQTIGAGATVFMSWDVPSCPPKTSKVTNNVMELTIPNPGNVWRPEWRFLTSATSNVYINQMEGVYGEDLVGTWQQYRTANELKLHMNFFWLIGGAYISSCELDLSNFPFDRQTCIFSFALIRSTRLVQFNESAINLVWPEKYEDGSEWIYKGQQIVVGTIFYRALPTSGVHFSITNARDPSYYITNIVVPTVLLAFVELTTFVMPPAMPDRPTLSMTVLLALTFSQSTVTSMVPQTSQRVLLIDFVQYLTSLSTACLFYQMLACCIGIYYYKTDSSVNSKQFGKCKMSALRLADIIAFSIGACLFILILVVGFFVTIF